MPTDLVLYFLVLPHAARSALPASHGRRIAPFWKDADLMTTTPPNEAPAEPETPETSRPSLIPIKTGGSKPPLFFIHGGHGQIFQYLKLAPLLDDDQPVYGLEAQGLWGDQPPQTSVEDMAARYIREIREVQPEGPYTILAFSAGGVMSWEMAQQLRRAGETTLLGLLDAPAPSGGTGDGPPRSSFLAQMGLNARIIVFHLRNLATLSMSGRRTYWRELSRGQIGGEPAGWLARRLGRGEGDQRVGRERPAGHFPVRRGLSKARRDYTVQPYDGQVTQFRTRIQHPRANQEDRSRGWAKFASAGVEIVDVPGHHEYMFVDPHIKTLAREITAWAARARSSKSSETP